jgi:hypothetical protein
MKSSKGNNNEVLNLSLSLKNIAKMSDEEILSKIGEAKIVKEIYDEFADLYARLNYTDDFAKMFAEKPELIFEYEKAVKDLKFDFNIVENSSNTFEVGKYVSVIFPEKIRKEFKDKIILKTKEISISSSWEYFTVSFRVHSKHKSEDKVISSLSRYLKEKLSFTDHIYHSKKSSEHYLKTTTVYLDKNKSLSRNFKDHLIELLNLKVGVNDRNNFLSRDNKLFLKSFISDEDEKILLKDYCDKVRKKALELSAKFLIEEDVFSFKDLEARTASLDYFTDKKIKSELRYNNNFRAIKELLYNETKENKKRFADIITELLLE